MKYLNQSFPPALEHSYLEDYKARTGYLDIPIAGHPIAMDVSMAAASATKHQMLSL
jgi:hypothetical protein